MKHYVVALVCLLLAAATTAEPLNTIIDLSHESPSPISSLEMENWHTFLKDAQPSSDHVESIDIKVIIQKIFDFYQIPVQAAECVTDLEGAETNLRDFVYEFEGKEYQLAMNSLADAVLMTSSAMRPCNVRWLEAQLDTLAAALGWTNIMHVDFDTKIIIGAADLTKLVAKLSADVEARDENAIAADIKDILSEWTNIGGGCMDSEELNTCKFIDGFLKVVQTAKKDYQTCIVRLKPVVKKFEYVALMMQNKFYSNATSTLADAMDMLATELKSSDCNIKPLGYVIADLVPSVKKSIIKYNDIVPDIMVGYVNIFDALSHVADAVAKHDPNAFGIACGHLLETVRAAGCKNPVCDIVGGLLAIYQQTIHIDLNKCMNELNSAWNHFEYAFEQLKQVTDKHAIETGIISLARGFEDVSGALKTCHEMEIAKIMEETANKIGKDTWATEIDNEIHIISDAVDITDFVQAFVADVQAKRWVAVGQHFSQMANELSRMKICNNIACEIVRGLLGEAGIVFQSLEECESDLVAAGDKFFEGAHLMEEKKVAEAMTAWSEGLNIIVRATKDCNLDKSLEWIEQEAHLMGFANVTTEGIAKDIAIFIHEVDFFPTIIDAYKDFATRDYRAVGRDMKKILDELAEWTGENGCDKPGCYILIGVMQFVGVAQGGLHQCVADIENSFVNFTDAYHDISDANSHSGFWHWNDDKAEMEEGIGEIGAGVGNLANAVSDCHLQEFSIILAELAAHLSLPPEIEFLRTLFKVLIGGVDIAKAVSGACIDFSHENWVGFGYNIARLVKDLEHVIAWKLPSNVHVTLPSIQAPLTEPLPDTVNSENAAAVFEHFKATHVQEVMRAIHIEEN